MPQRRAKTAFITGIAGQDGSYLAQLLREKGYRVVGLLRASGIRLIPNLIEAFGSKLRDEVTLYVGDVTDAHRLTTIIQAEQPDEVYNLASVSYVPDSWDSPDGVFKTNVLGTLAVIRAVRSGAPEARIYQASSSEQFASDVQGAPIDEEGLMVPRSPYGISKLAAHRLATLFRDTYGTHISCGIAFNHESPRRDDRFLSRKIAICVAEIARGIRKEIVLGDVRLIRDWGWAPDYVEAMWRMVQMEEPGDLVLATGVGHTVYDFYRFACAAAGITRGIDRLRTDTALVRPRDPMAHIGDPELAAAVLDWKPTVKFEGLVVRMVEYELSRLAARGSTKSKRRKR